MSAAPLDRRDFHRLSLAALGGALAGCSSDRPEDEGAPPLGAPVDPLLAEPHVCRGLNTCKGKGAGGDNACAGTGSCATAVAHSCQGMNDCRGQGGCAGSAGRNECAGRGGCAVPLQDEAWARVRPLFEQAAAEAGMQVGAAPPAG